MECRILKNHAIVEWVPMRRIQYEYKQLLYLHCALPAESHPEKFKKIVLEKLQGNPHDDINDKVRDHERMQSGGSLASWTELDWHGHSNKIDAKPGAPCETEYIDRLSTATTLLMRDFKTQASGILCPSACPLSVRRRAERKWWIVDYTKWFKFLKFLEEASDELLNLGKMFNS